MRKILFNLPLYLSSFAAAFPGHVPSNTEPGQVSTHTPAPRATLGPREYNPATEIHPFSDLGPESAFTVQIEQHSKYLTVQGTSTKWVGSSKIPVTSTKTSSSTKSAVTTSVGISLTEVSVAGNGKAVGDWEALITPDAYKEITDAISRICSLTKRDGTGSCRSMAQNDFNDRVWDAVRDVLFRQAGIDLTFTAGDVQAIANAGVGAGIVLTGYVLYNIYEGVIPYAAHLPKQKVNQAQAQAEAQAATATTSSKQSCPSSVEKKPSCDSSDCKGSKGKCTVEGQHKDCECSPTVTMSFENFGKDPAFWDAQQAFLVSLAGATISSSTTASSPWCLYGAAPMQAREPKSYCQCGDNHATMYSVASGSSPCPYGPTSHPSATIVFTTPAPTSATATTSPSPTSSQAAGSDGKPPLLTKACRVDQNSTSPEFDRGKAISSIKSLCKQKLQGDKNGCIQATSKDDKVRIFMQAWVYEDQDLLKPCSTWPFWDDKYMYEDGFEDLCVWSFMSALDDCDQGNHIKKKGGSNMANCVRYVIGGYNNGDPVPYKSCPLA